MAYGNALAALADPTRRRLVERLRRGPTTVSELTSGLGISQPAVSQHLGVLRGARLVRSRRDGRRRIYRLDRRGLEDVRRYIDRMWDDALDAFARSFESEAPKVDGENDE